MNGRIKVIDSCIFGRRKTKIGMKIKIIIKAVNEPRRVNRTASCPFPSFRS